VRRWDYGNAYPHKRFHALLETLLGQKVDVLLAADTENGADPKVSAVEGTVADAALATGREVLHA
jgi:hypothetical protein